MPENKDKPEPTSAKAEAAAPGVDSPLKPAPLPEAPKPKPPANFATALKAAKDAGVKKLTITIDVDAFCAPAEMAAGNPTKFEAQVGTGYVNTAGKDILDGIVTLAERVSSHPVAQAANPGRTHAKGEDPTVADIHRTRPAFTPSPAPKTEPKAEKK